MLSTQSSIQKLIQESVSQKIQLFICSEFQENIGTSLQEIKENDDGIQSIVEFLQSYAERENEYNERIAIMKSNHECEVQRLSKQYRNEKKKWQTEKNQMMAQNQKLNKQVLELNDTKEKIDKKCCSLNSKLLKNQQQLEKSQFIKNNLQKQLTDITQFISEQFYAILSHQHRHIHSLLSYEKLYFEEHSSFIGKKHQLQQKEIQITEFISTLSHSPLIMQGNQSSYLEIEDNESISEKQLGNGVQLILQKNKTQINNLGDLIQKLIDSRHKAHEEKRQISTKYQNFLMEAKQKMHIVKQKNRSLSDKIIQLKKQNEELKIEVVEAHNHNIQSRDKVTFLQKKLEEIEKNSVCRQNQLVTEINKLEQQISRLNSEVEKCSRELSAKNVEIESLKDSLSTLKNTFEQIMNKKCTSKSQSTKKNDPDHEEFQCKIDEFCDINEPSHNIDSIIQENKEEDYFDQLEFDSCVMEHMIDKNYEIHLQNNKLKQTIKNLEEKISKSSNQMINLSEKYQQEIEEISIKKDELEHRIKSLIKEIAIKSKEIENLTKMNQIKNSQIEELEIVMRTLFDSQTSLHQTISKLSYSHSFLEKKVMQQQLKIKELEPQKRSGLGKIINTKNINKDKQNIEDNSQHQNRTQKNNQRSDSQEDSLTSKEEKMSKYLQSISNLNEIINYMINYLKGFTRNGLRQNSWASAQGEKYLTNIQSNNSLKLKYSNFQKIRQISLSNKHCRQVIRDFEIIANFYFTFLPSQNNYKTEETLENENITQTRCINVSYKGTDKSRYYRGISSDQVTPKKVRDLKQLLVSSNIEEYKNEILKNTGATRRSSIGMISAGSIGKNLMRKGNKNVQSQFNKTKKIF